jgi:hypothetical protein
MQRFPNVMSESPLAGNDAMWDDFEPSEIDTEETHIFVRRSGTGPPLLLLHGFPQTHLMWRSVAPLLARDFTVVCADLRGYGRSGCPPSAPDHAPYTKRAMAGDMIVVMERLGFAHFSVAGHDRGGRVAYRMALDHPSRIERIAVLDICLRSRHGTAQMRGSLWHIGHGRSWRNPSLFRNASLRRYQKPSLTMPSDDGVHPQVCFRRSCERLMFKLCKIPRMDTPSARNIVPLRRSIDSTTKSIGQQGGV